MTDAVQLLGKHIEDPLVRAFLIRHGGGHELEPPDDDLPDRRYVTTHDSGVELSTDLEGMVRVVYLHLNGHEAKPAFVGDLPLGLSAGFMQRDVRRLLGQPQFERPGRDVPLLGRYGPSDRYDFDAYSIHLQYAETSSSLVLVTVMVRSAVPGQEVAH
jgi:hypothetical protein